MSEIILNNTMNYDALVIPGSFIDNFLPAAGGTDIKVYLFLLRAAASGQGISTAALSDRLALTESELLRSLNYWEKAGLIRLSFSSEHILNGVSLLDIPSSPASNPASAPTPQADIQDTVQPAPVRKTAQPGAAETRSDFSLSQEERAMLDNDQELAVYMGAWGQYFPKLLTPSDIERIEYWYLRFDKNISVIDYLIEYCVNSGHTSMNYISKVAMNWHQSGLRDINEIRAFNQFRNETIYGIMNAFGLYNQNPAPAQLKYFDRWINEYGFSGEMINLACSRCMNTLQKPDLNYTEGILKNWKKKNITTPEAASEDDSLHSIRTQRAARQTPAARQPSKFSNFNERPNNYTEKILKQYSQN